MRYGLKDALLNDFGSTKFSCIRELLYGAIALFSNRNTDIDYNYVLNVTAVIAMI